MGTRVVYRENLPGKLLNQYAAFRVVVVTNFPPLDFNSDWVMPVRTVRAYRRKDDDREQVVEEGEEDVLARRRGVRNVVVVVVAANITETLR